MALWTKIPFILCFCCTGFCSIDDDSWWQAYKGSFFKFVQVPLTYQMAEAHCRDIGPGVRLARANGSDFLRFFKQIQGPGAVINSSLSYWLEQNSWTNEPYMEHPMTTEELCPYGQDEYIRFEFCKTEKDFICQVEELPLSCPSGFERYIVYCLGVMMNRTAYYSDAVEACETQGGNIASLDSELKRAAILLALHSMKIEKSSYFVNASSDILQTVPKDNRNLNCTVIKFEQNLVGDKSGLLVRIGCNESTYYMCEADFLTASTESTTPMTTLAPLLCPHGQNWKSHEDSGSCFWETTYESERLNWYEAREFCKLYGGDLASYINEAQESIGLGGARGHYKGLWIGLKRDQNDVFHWTDGTTLNFSNWMINQPNLKSKTKFCVVHGAGHSKWQLDYCGVRRWFICKAPKARSLNPIVVPQRKKKACNIQDVSIYSKDWYEFEDYCYMAHTGKYTWDTAKTFCQDNGGHMASIHSFKETDFILYLIGLFPDSNYWIGLGVHGLHASYSWSDGTPLDFIYWTDERTDGEGINSCISFNKRDGSWDTDHCNRLQSVVCKRGVNATYNFSTTEPTVVMPGNCEDGWYNYGNKCYKYFATLWTQRVTWAEAKRKCDYMNASLVSIHSKAEQDLITDIVLDANAEFWIGLESREMGSVYHWSDESRMDYTNWDSGEPAYSRDSDLFMVPSINSLCVVVEHSEQSMGKWNDISCTEKKGYLCEKMKNPTITQYRDPFQCQNNTGWYRLGSSCYGLFEELQLTWLQAQAECRKHGANLVTYQNAAVSVFLKRKLKNVNDYFWIGLLETEENKYKYITGMPVFYTNWMATQPMKASSRFDNCAATKASGGWLIKSCKEKHPFICKTKHSSSEGNFSQGLETVTGEDTPTRRCDNAVGVNWFDFGGTNCYLLSLEVKRCWTEAMHYCFKHNGYLASLHSVEDTQKLIKAVDEYTRDKGSTTVFSIHIGLGRKYDGSYAWVDNSPVDFTNWEDDQPRELTLSNSGCVRMSLTTGKWSVVYCDDIILGFACSLPKRLSFMSAVNTSNNQAVNNNLSKKLTVGGIFGIIICVTVILAIAGLAIYYLRPSRKQIQPKLLDQEPL